MKEIDEKIPDPKELEKEIGEFLTKKFGDNVKKIISPITIPKSDAKEPEEPLPKKDTQINFDLLPEDLVAYLNQFIIKQDSAKEVLATKICTHFNRIKHLKHSDDDLGELVGSIKSNILMIGPTGVGKTYMIKLIAKRLGVPFVKGDATKFSETGYVGGDVEDLVRDLVREADGDIERAQYGIIYIDEIDKIASSHNLIGADVSRTGVQRALLKPMEETEVDTKVPHDPITMIQEIESFRKSGKREKRTVNTKNILFIMSGAFSDLKDIIKKRIVDQGIGFASQVTSARQDQYLFNYVKSEDLVTYGFESEFIGRLPVRAIFERLTESDLFEILKNPNNPITLGKRVDFAAYGIDIKFSDPALKLLAKEAYDENTGARGLVNAVEKYLLRFERKLPSSTVRKLAVTEETMLKPSKTLEMILDNDQADRFFNEFDLIAKDEKKFIKQYVKENFDDLANKYKLTLTGSRIDIIAEYYSKNIMDIGKVIQKIKSYYDEVKKIELYFYQNHDINIVLEEDAIDYIIEQLVINNFTFDYFYRKLSDEFNLGLKLIRDKTGKNRFFISRSALIEPEDFLNKTIKLELS